MKIDESYFSDFFVNNFGLSECNRVKTGLLCMYV